MTIFDTPPEDPFGLFDSWMADAARSEVNDPNAMALATADDDALPAHQKTATVCRLFVTGGLASLGRRRTLPVDFLPDRVWPRSGFF